MKFGKTVGVVATLLVVAIVAAAVAGSVYDRATKTIPNTGSTVWTNTTKYAALELKRIWIEGNKNATSTVTVTRVTSDGTYTQAVGTVACTGNKGSTATFTAAYLANGDKLAFANGVTTGATAIIEYEVQQH